jgi:hypothetical protein
MHARTRVPVAAVIGALVLSASAAHGQVGAPHLPAPSEAPQASVPEPEPGPELKPVVPDAIGQAVDPEPAVPDPEERPTRELAAPRMIHEPRQGFVSAGGIVFGATYALQLLAAFAVAVSGTDSGGCSYCSNQAGILLIPILGPVVVSLDPPGQGAGSLAIGFTLGGLELAGAAMLVVGLIGHDVPQAPYSYGRIAFLPFVAPQTQGLTMSMRW